MGYKEGFGVYEDLSGYRYRGDWRRSEKWGFGVESGITLDGREYVYEGGFLRNQRHGIGTKNGFIKVKYKYGRRDDDCVIM
jgi:MORN repeat